MKARFLFITFLILMIICIPIIHPVLGSSYDETDSGIYIDKQKRFELTLRGNSDLSYFVIYLNASGGRNINWKISVLEGGSFQLFFMKGHVNAELMLSMMGGLYMEYFEQYSRDTDVKSASDSFYNNGDNSRFTILLINEGTEDVNLSVDVSISKDDFPDIKIFLYCCGGLFLFVLIPSIIVTIVKALGKKRSQEDQWRVVAGDISTQTPNDNQNITQAADPNMQYSNFDGSYK